MPRVVGTFFALLAIAFGSAVGDNEIKGLCHQLKNGRATISLLTTMVGQKVLLLDSYFRGYLVSSDLLKTPYNSPPWLNLTGQKAIRLNAGNVPEPATGRGVFYFTANDAHGEKLSYLGVFWPSLANITILPINPAGPATNYGCRTEDDWPISNVVLSNPGFYDSHRIYIASAGRDRLSPYDVVLSGDTVILKQPFDMTTPMFLAGIDGGFYGEQGSFSNVFYGFSNCDKALLQLDVKKGIAVSLANFLLCSADERPPQSYRPESESNPECYELEPTTSRHLTTSKNSSASKWDWPLTYGCSIGLLLLAGGLGLYLYYKKRAARRNTSSRRDKPSQARTSSRKGHSSGIGSTTTSKSKGSVPLPRSLRAPSSRTRFF